MCQNQQHPRFHLLLLWCSLLTVAVVAMAALLLTTQLIYRDKAPPQGTNAPAVNARVEGPLDASNDRHVLHIQLTMDHNKSWKNDSLIRYSSTLRSLSFLNNTVHIRTGGLYHFYAHATFAPCGNHSWKTVTLYRNAIPGRIQEVKLSEAVHSGAGEVSVSVTKGVSCRSGESVRLEIQPGQCLRWNVEKTYWGLFLLATY